MVHLVGATLLLLAPIHVTNAGSLTFLKATKHHQHLEQHVEEGVFTHRGDCWAHRPVHKNFDKNHKDHKHNKHHKRHNHTSLHNHTNLMQQTPRSLRDPQLALPGAGMHPEDIEPFQMVTKDGFLMTACVNDAMLEHGDKFGNGKFSYKKESSAVSIVHYSEIIPKEDREKMTINRCFDFCRTVPNMVFFGLNAGRDCYCMPFYEAVAVDGGDSANCDRTCEGDPSQMCGGDAKSSIFEMHSCADTKSDLEDIITEVEDEIFFHFQDLAGHLKDVCDEGQSDTVALQGIFGAAGASDMSAYMQEAKVYIGEILESVTAADKLIDAMQDPFDAAQRSLRRNLQNFDNIKVAENAIKDLKDGLAKAAKIKDTMHDHMKTAHPVSQTGEEGYNISLAEEQYYPIMYFADPEYQKRFVVEQGTMFHAPTTCTGTLLQIIFGGGAGDCAHACDGLPGKCDGFQFMDFNDGMCFVFESIKTVQQWNGCTPATPAPFNTQCMAKLSRLEGVGGIAPRENRIMEEARKTRQGTGKCAHCLDSMDRSSRCYEYGAKCIGNKWDWEAWWDMPQYSHAQNYRWAKPWTDGGTLPRLESACERLAAYAQRTCSWTWGRKNYYNGAGQYLKAGQVCPQCGYCIDNGKAASNPYAPWTNENWAIDDHNFYYDYYYYHR